MPETLQQQRVHRDNGGSGIVFWCPGCECHHRIIDGVGMWSFDDDMVAPTITPSIRVEWTVYDDKEEPVKHLCHLFVTDGRLQYLPDCTHKLAGQTVHMKPWGLE